MYTHLHISHSVFSCLKSTMRKIFSKLTIKTLEQITVILVYLLFNLNRIYYTNYSGVSTVDFEQVNAGCIVQHQKSFNIFSGVFTKKLLKT